MSTHQYKTTSLYLDYDREIEIGFTYTGGYPATEPDLSGPGHPGANAEIDIYAVSVIDDQGKMVNLSFWSKEFERGMCDELCEHAESE